MLRPIYDADSQDAMPISFRLGTYVWGCRAVLLMQAFNIFYFGNWSGCIAVPFLILSHEYMRWTMKRKKREAEVFYWWNRTGHADKLRRQWVEQELTRLSNMVDETTQQGKNDAKKVLSSVVPDLSRLYSESLSSRRGRGFAEPEASGTRG